MNVKINATILAALVLGGALLIRQPAAAQEANSGGIVVLPNAYIVQAIDHYAAVYGVSPAYLEAVAMCESRMEPGQVGPLGTVGVFQWLPGGVWDETPQAAAGESPRDLDADISAAAWAFAHGLGGNWSCA